MGGFWPFCKLWELSTIMNNFFINITKDLEMKKDSEGKLNNLEDILKAIKSHPSIEKCIFSLDGSKPPL